jgi:hypothetical protein
MKTTEEIIEIFKEQCKVFLSEDFAKLAIYQNGKIANFVHGYRTAEGEYTQAIRELVAELEEARDDVEHCLNLDMLKRPANKPAIEAGQDQLARIDALIAKWKEPNNG